MQKQGQAPLIQVFLIVFGTILWFAMWRGQGEITVNFLEELWSENLTNLFASPLRVAEWMVGLCIVGILKLFLTISLTATIALFLYKANILSLGVWLLPFVTTLVIFSWAFGFFTAGLFLRKGTDVQTLAWAGAFILMPFSGVYYPLAVLPKAVQVVASILPSSYVFEGMRGLLINGQTPEVALVKSFALSFLYLALAIGFFYRSFKVARKNGLGHLK
jgi:ABC-2 type transport system permease protein